MGKIEVDKIVVETYSPGFSQKYELSSITLNNPKLSKITLVIEGKNIALYEGKEFGNINT